MRPLRTEGIRAVLLDIEGTTTPVSFVSDVLFPYARTHAADFLGRHWEDPEVQADIARLQAEYGAEAPDAALPAGPGTVDAAVEYIHYLMDRDRKSTALKALQGRIWEDGYRTGELRGEVFADVPPALARWRRQGKRVAIFSSGSVRAQKLLFSTTAAGDLTRFLDAYFDTTTGPKREAPSYRAIARVLALDPTAILFLSDVVGELDAAEEAGMVTALCMRHGEAVAERQHPVLFNFDSVCP